MQGSVLRVVIRACYMISIPLVSIIHIILNTYRPNTHVLNTFFDDMIPYNKYFAVPYLYWFAYLFLVLVFFAVVDNRYYFRLVMSIISGMLISYIIFYFFPTTVPRSEVYGSDIFAELVRFVYRRDNPYNCFPSIHVLNSLLVTLFFCKYNKNRILRWAAIISCISICMSTLFIKQHYIADIIAAAALGLLMYKLFTNEYLWKKLKMERVIDFLEMPRAKNKVSS